MESGFSQVHENDLSVKSLYPNYETAISADTNDINFNLIWKKLPRQSELGISSSNLLGEITLVLPVVGLRSSYLIENMASVVRKALDDDKL